MTDLSEWAKREAENRYPTSWEDRGRTDRDNERDAFEEGVDALAALLLSYEACEAAARRLFPEGVWKYWIDEARAALRAALAAITEEKE